MAAVITYGDWAQGGRRYADTAQTIQGGRPPYLRAAIVPGQGGRLCRGTRPCPGSMAAVIIFGSPPPWGEGARVMGAGGSPRQCAINLKRGLPTAPILGGAEGGLSASYPSAGFLLFDSSYRYFYVIEHLLGWFCHSHGDTTVSPKRRILVIILLSSSHLLAFIFLLLVCICNVFLFCCVFLLVFIGVFLPKYH